MSKEAMTTMSETE